MGNGSREATVPESRSPHSRLVAAALGRRGTSGVDLRILRSLLLRILRRSPCRRTARLAN